LHDLGCYNEKHNATNGEDDRGGESHNHGWNYGAEGPNEGPEVSALRERSLAVLRLEGMV